MVTGYEVQMYHDINQIRRDITRIANALERIAAQTSSEEEENKE